MIDMKNIRYGQNGEKIAVLIEKQYKYNGTHPLEEVHYYENMLEEHGLIELALTGIEDEGKYIKLTIEEQ